MEKKELCEEALSAVNGGLTAEELLARAQAERAVIQTKDPLADVAMDFARQKWQMDRESAEKAAESARLEALGNLPRDVVHVLGD